jgi:hypothetical protein
MEKRLLELERAVWDLKIRLKVLEGLHGIRGQGALPELRECVTNGKEVDRLDAWAQSLG